jgi:hypothetical protein
MGRGVIALEEPESDGVHAIPIPLERPALCLGVATAAALEDLGVVPGLIHRRRPHD